MISGWGGNDFLFPYTSCDASLGPDFNPAAYAQCYWIILCYSPAEGGGGGQAVAAAQAAATQATFLKNAEAMTCKGLPDGVVMAASVSAVAGLGVGLSGEVVFNMNSGQVSVFGAYTFTAAGSPSASASLQGGFIWGLGQSNSSYSGPFTNVSIGAGVVAAALATTSQGLTNPFNFSTPTSATIGVQTPGASFSYGISQYSNPLNVGNLNNPIFDAAFSALSPGMFAEIQSYYSIYQGLCGSH